MKPLLVLIVEDEMLLSMDLEDMLIVAGHTVAGGATDMHQAISICERDGHCIDLALMDVNLARGTSGVETAKILRERWDIPSLFISGNIDDRMQADAAPSRPVGFIGKPFSEKSILAAVTKALPVLRKA